MYSDMFRSKEHMLDQQLTIKNEQAKSNTQRKESKK